MSTASSDDRLRVVQESIREVMDGNERLARPGLLAKLQEMLSAQRSVFATHEGRISDERTVPDNSAQLRALNMAFTLRDEYPHTAGVAVGVSIRMEQLPDLSHLSVRELSRLAAVSEQDDEPVPSDVVNGNGSAPS